jgi:hypothetical protein
LSLRSRNHKFLGKAPGSIDRIRLPERVRTWSTGRCANEPLGKVPICENMVKF